MTYNTRSFGGKVGRRDESCAHSGELMIPTGIVNSRSVSRTDGDFDPRGRFGRYDDWTMWVAWVNGEVTGVRSFLLFLFLSLLLVFLSRFPKERGCFLFDSLGLQVVEHMFLLSDDAMEGEGKVSDSLSDVVLGRLKLYLGVSKASQAPSRRVCISPRWASMLSTLPIAKIRLDFILVKEVVAKAEVICVISNPSVKLIVVDVGDGALREVGQQWGLLVQKQWS